MAKIRFRFGASEHCCDYPPDSPATLLELAQRGDVPVHWRCGFGTCGTCAVRLTVLSGSPGPVAPLEHNVLTRENKSPTVAPPGKPQWRLACQYVPSGENAVVDV